MAYGTKVDLEIIEGKIAVVKLCEPKGLNPVGQVFLDELSEIQDVIDANKDLRVVLIKSEGKIFSAGIDINFLVDNISSQWIMDTLVSLQNIYNRWQDLPIPVIAVVNKSCFGSGVELILGCDFRIADTNASFTLPEARFGLSPDMGGTAKLTKLVGAGQAKRILMTGDTIKADEALRIGLVEIVVEAEDLQETAMSYAKRIAALPPLALRFVKKGVNAAEESSLAAGLLFEQAQSTFCAGTQDLQEGLRSFTEKRDPVYQGK
jgi:enoyl-CoA hydratase